MLSKRINGWLIFYGLLIVGLPGAGLVNALLYSVGLAGPLAPGFTLRHWQQIGTETGLIRSRAFSLYIALVSVGLAVGIALALVLGARNTLTRRPFPTVLYVPLLFPSLVMGFYLFQLLSRSGWLSRISYGIGLTTSIKAFPNLVQDAGGVGIILAHVLMAFPFLTLLFNALYTDARLADYHSLTQTLQRFDLAELPVGYGAGFLIAVLLMGVIGWLSRLVQRGAL